MRWQHAEILLERVEEVDPLQDAEDWKHCSTSKFKSLRSSLHRAQGLCESRGGCPGLPVCNSPYGLCGRKATLNFN